MLQNYLHSLNKVSLADLDSVSLLNRLDSKYVVSVSKLDLIFQFIQYNYAVLEIDGVRKFNYENNYFDTPDLLFFNDHHNGYASRLKVRSRKYIESNKSYFEIKKKEHINRTNKYRTTVSDLLTDLNSERLQKVQTLTRKKIDSLNFILKNNFKRITLVDNDFQERVTIDTDLVFINENQEISFDKIAIIEIKQSKNNNNSKLISFFKKNEIRSQSISKYILGTILLNPDIKHNKFLPIIKKINNITQN